MFSVLGLIWRNFGICLLTWKPCKVVIRPKQAMESSTVGEQKHVFPISSLNVTQVRGGSQLSDCMTHHCLWWWLWCGVLWQTSPLDSQALLHHLWYTLHSVQLPPTSCQQSPENMQHVNTGVANQLRQTLNHTKKDAWGHFYISPPQQ